MGGHDHGIPKIPDYSIYKVEGLKQLEDLQAKLAKKGLKDPWIRNHAWKYMAEKKYPNKYLKYVLFRGWQYAIPAVLITIGLEQYFGISYYGYHHSDGGHDGHGKNGGH